MKIENPSYVRLDDDVSFQILRTNPKLTSNTKVMYDGKNLFMDSYNATPLLSTRTYKSYKLIKNGLFNKDISNFLAGSGAAAYTVGQNMGDTIVGDTYDNQFETMYWSGVESIKSYIYPQEMGFIAPLYLRKKLPNYFVIFKIDTPANTNLVEGVNDTTYDFKEDVMKRAKIIKTFDLREGTPIGDYIQNYVGQKDFKYDRSIYVNFGAQEIYYYGIDRSLGVLTQKMETFTESLLQNDNTIQKADEWITSGFDRNELIFPYIINFEFLFDDDMTDEFQFARYFGMYCNDIDLYDLDVTGIGLLGNVFTNWNNNTASQINIGDSSFYYIKDKYNDLYSIDSNLVVYGTGDVTKFNGFELDSISMPAERMEGLGNSTMMIRVKDKPTESDKIWIKTGNTIIRTIEANNRIGPGEYKRNEFSIAGTKENVAESLALTIDSYMPTEYEWVSARAIGDVIVITSLYPGSLYNEMLTIETSSCFEKLMDKFTGGTDAEGCLFKICAGDKDVFYSPNENLGECRYMRCGKNKSNAAILNVIPYINSDNVIDEDYYVAVTDWYGPYVRTSKTGHLEILDRFYAKVGTLSFFPVKDFDFDTVDSAYGNDVKMQCELKDVNKYLEETDQTGLAKSVCISLTLDEPMDDNNNPVEDDDSWIIDITSPKTYNYDYYDTNNMIPYGRFFTDGGYELNTEYEYFCENLIPSLCLANKTVPYIAKWGYMDDSKDSCENSYRLNTSKIFDACNFSANTFVIAGDILEYTHSMPYYVINDEEKASDINEYQYIYNSISQQTESTDFAEYIDVWLGKFSNQETDYFEKLFMDSSSKQFTSKRFNKKYSRFLNGSDISNASTLFRGVKFEVIELVDGKEVKTSKYNDYRFTFIYIPFKDHSAKLLSNKVYFVKNDKFKFIVGMTFFTMDEEEGIPFSKGNAYAGSLGWKISKDDESVEEEEDITNGSESETSQE